MIKAVIIDDEKDARFLLRNSLENNFIDDIAIVGEGSDVSSGIEVIKNQNPDLVFLDVQMPEGTGFDLLTKLDRINFEVIFITAFNQYALKAFQFSAFGYLMKPIKSSELSKVIESLKSKLEKEVGDTEKRLKVLIDNFSEEGKVKKLIVSNTEGFKVLELSEILYLEGDRNYSNFRLTNNRKLTVSKTLKQYEELLVGHGFFRIHQSYLVNLTFVKEYMKGDGGSVVMNNNDVLKVARNRKQEFIKQFI